MPRFSHTTVAAIGSPHRSAPSPSPPASRLRRATTVTMTAPAIEPTPVAVLSQPTAALPPWSRRSAITTSSTSNAPATTICAAVRPTITRSAGWRPTVRRPSASSRSARCRPARCGRSSRGIRSTQSNDQRKVAPFTAKTADGPLSAERTPPSAGPANMLTLEIVLPTRFAAVSSSGDSTSDGHQCRLGRAVWAGDDRRRDREHEHRPRRSAGGSDRGHRGEDAEPNRVCVQHHLPPRPAVREHAEPGCRNRREDETGEEEEPDRPRPARVVRVDGECHRVRPRSQRRRGARDFGCCGRAGFAKTSANARSDSLERPGSLTEPGSQPDCEFEERVGRFRLRSSS